MSYILDKQYGTAAPESLLKKGDRFHERLERKTILFPVWKVLAAVFGALFVLFLLLIYFLL